TIQSNSKFCECSEGFRKRFNCKKALMAKTISRIGKKFRETGQVTTQRKGNSGRKPTQTTPENVERARAAFSQKLKKSVRRTAQQLELSFGTTHRIIHKSLKLYPYKIQIQQ